jgi:hypothetical protein
LKFLTAIRFARAEMFNNRRSLEPYVFWRGMTKGWLSFARTCPEQIAQKRQIDLFGNVEQEQRYR